MKGAMFAIAVYVGTGGVVSEAMINPTMDNFVAAVLAMCASFYTFEKRLDETTLADAKKALTAARKQLAEQNALLRAMRDAVDADDLEPIRAYWRRAGK